MKIDQATMEAIDGLTIAGVTAAVAGIDEAGLIIAQLLEELLPNTRRTQPDEFVVACYAIAGLAAMAAGASITAAEDVDTDPILWLEQHARWLSERREQEYG